MEEKERAGLEKRLMAYAAAAAGVLALAPTAEAAVHYSGPKDLTLSPQTSPVTIDLNSDGANDFRFSAYGFGTTYTYSGFQYAFSVGVQFLRPITSGGRGGTGIIEAPETVFSSYTLPFPARLATGYKIQNTLQNYGWNGTSFGILGARIQYKYGTRSYSYSFGNFNNSMGCLGVRFKTADGVRYGWIRYQGTSASSGIIKDWAYEDSGGPIAACVVPNVNVPTLNQWGIMVLIALLAGMSIKVLKTDKSGQDS